MIQTSIFFMYLIEGIRFGTWEVLRLKWALVNYLKVVTSQQKQMGGGGLNHFCQLSIYDIWVQISVASVAPLVARCIQNGHFTSEKPRKIAAWNHGKAA